ncbi:NTP transferase domain-containing protein [Helcococcus ovis]|uniref:Choline-phosphate cytidylyltransferase n=1 Tax=Helcococcus ovis TaxID=72026 RepID=A0A4R9C1W0_9FIRM|nr:NTP transferase domain-containing protein [Helcococcus ovis]TFF65103.1 choline-phosphate cytidylyltransferase [Helcococcus ovis]TFF66747.1 choline-phosphate cytidylyltransferase [Helcococcus ovis]TFF67407.1 choline-phosphate cytidylyltransferase [Helcococcus ovis]WNZ01529.1 NTP transferase domain-containing protein [Helcococcus ovis]
MYKVDNAIILAAGASSRFAPLSYEMPKGLVVVRGEVLIERQIKQIKEKGIDEIIVVTGYQSEKFNYLSEKFGVKIIQNTQYDRRNNNSSIYVVRDYLKNSYICSVDNYFNENPFEKYVEDSYYSVLYSKEFIDEWCVTYDDEEYITGVKIGAEDSWYMLGHTFWNENFSKRFKEILELVYDDENTYDLLWESIYLNHLDTLKMKIRKYPDNFIFEFDSLNELREFDISYIGDTRSKIIKSIALKLNCLESELNNFVATKDFIKANGFDFNFNNKIFHYDYETKKLVQKGENND